MNEHESAAMWKIYGATNKSVAISSTVGDFKEAINNTDYPINIGKVFYVDYTASWQELDSESQNALDNALHQTNRDLYENLRLKRRSFEYEKEVRMFATFPTASHPNPFTWKTHDDFEISPAS